MNGYGKGQKVETMQSHIQDSVWLEHNTCGEY